MKFLFINSKKKKKCVRKGENIFILYYKTLTDNDLRKLYLFYKEPPPEFSSDISTWTVVIP